MNRYQTVHMTRCLAAVLAVLVAATLWRAPEAATANAGEDDGTVLLIYDSLAKGTSSEGNVEALQRLLSAFGVPVELMPSDQYRAGMLTQYERVIGITNMQWLDITEEAYANDLKQYTGRYLHIGATAPPYVLDKLQVRGSLVKADKLKLEIEAWSQANVRTPQMYYVAEATGKRHGVISSMPGGEQSPFAVLDGKVGYIPYYASGDLSELAAAYVLVDWLDAQRTGKPYVLISNIHPFMEPEAAAALGDSMSAAGIPFMLAASPVFQHYDYPAMRRYIHALKFAQQKGGSVLVQAPVISANSNHLGRSLNDQLSAFVDELAANGVAPLGFRAELYWSYDRYLDGEALGLFDSVVFGPNARIMHTEVKHRAESFPSSMYEVSLDLLSQLAIDGSLPVDELPVNIVVTAGMAEEQHELDEIVERLIGTGLVFADYRYGEHATQTEKSAIRSLSGQLFINGETAAIEETVELVDQDYVYQEENKGNFASFLNVQSRIFLIAITGSLIVFALLLLVGRRMYKRKFYR